MAALTRSGHTIYYRYKGEASCFRIRTGGDRSIECGADGQIQNWNDDMDAVNGWRDDCAAHDCRIALSWWR
jgi:hypothetical protein